MDDDFQARVLKTGLWLYDLIEGETPSIFKKEYWTGKVIDRCMRDDAFRVELFRFVDVFPYLTHPEAVAKHLTEYFGRPELDFSSALQWGLRLVSPTSIGSGMAAKAIASNGLTASYIAPEPFNSEALLSLPVLQRLEGKRVIIFRGKGGLELLGDSLRERGAEVEYAECYERVKPETDTTTIFQIWDEGCTMPIVVTSNEGLENLYSMIDSAHQPALLSSPLIVVSQRAAALAKALGFKQAPLVAKSASNDAIISAIKQWKAT